jgi:putative oxidoreductase
MTARPDDPTPPRLVVPGLAGLYALGGLVAWPLLRIACGGFLLPHAGQKLFGWFGGYGLAGSAPFFEKLGLAPGYGWALAAALVEGVGGVLLILGLLTRLAALAVIVLMVVAVLQVHLANGFFWTSLGWEYPAFWGLVAFIILLRGGGPLSLDRAIGVEL